MLNVILETCAGTLTQGLIYAILSYGIFITYKILDLPEPDAPMMDTYSPSSMQRSMPFST